MANFKKNETLKLIKCPVCNEKYLSSAIKNHIIQSAVMELWHKEINNAKSIKHLAYYKKYYKPINKKELIIK